MTQCESAVLEITDDKLAELAAGCDPDFDSDCGELERQFAELRLTLDHNQS
jgi:hypothetical protein